MEDAKPTLLIYVKKYSEEKYSISLLKSVFFAIMSALK